MSYSTKQRTLLLEIFSNNPTKKFTGKQLFDCLSDKSISLSAIYRNLSAFEKDGLIKRFSEVGAQEISWQFNHEHNCHEAIHMTCTKCGKTYHIENEIANKIRNDITQFSDFTLEKTDLYGTCKNCRGKI